MSYQRSLVLLFALALLPSCGETFDLVDQDMGVGLSNGEVCGPSTAPCVSGFCVDGICCESACSGVCEACNVEGSKGTCAAVPENTDPAMECMPKPVEEVDGGVGDGGTVINVPDAGTNSMEGPCLPRCNGQRACAYPGATVACGDTFCNTPTQLGKSVCDGEGHCAAAAEDCVAYVCGPNACKTSCASNADCQTTHFCNVSGQCQIKKALGVSCGGNPAECQSGFCADGVCCNADCATFPAGKCNNVGAVGQCKCTIGGIQCDGVCEKYYRDADNDTFGDPAVFIDGCTGDPDNNPNEPAGYVLNKLDCGDDDNRVKPTAGFVRSASWTSVHTPAFDFDCDGVVEKEYEVIPGGVCRFCSPRTTKSGLSGSCLGLACGGTSTTCSVQYQEAFFRCGDAERTSGTFICTYYCCGMGCDGSRGEGGQSAFTTGGACGQFGTHTYCGSCTVAGGTVTGTDTYNEQQGCK